MSKKLLSKKRSWSFWRKDWNEKWFAISGDGTNFKEVGSEEALTNRFHGTPDLEASLNVFVIKVAELGPNYKTFLPKPMAVKIQLRLWGNIWDTNCKSPLGSLKLISMVYLIELKLTMPIINRNKVFIVLVPGQEDDLVSRRTTDRLLEWNRKQADQSDAEGKRRRRRRCRHYHRHVNCPVMRCRKARSPRSSCQIQSEKTFELHSVKLVVTVHIQSNQNFQYRSNKLRQQYLDLINYSFVNYCLKVWRWSLLSTSAKNVNIDSVILNGLIST